jgi:hypothetical protein
VGPSCRHARAERRGGAADCGLHTAETQGARGGSLGCAGTETNWAEIGGSGPNSGISLFSFILILFPLYSLFEFKLEFGFGYEFLP